MKKEFHAKVDVDIRDVQVDIREVHVDVREVGTMVKSLFVLTLAISLAAVLTSRSRSA